MRPGIRFDGRSGNPDKCAGSACRRWANDGSWQGGEGGKTRRTTPVVFGELGPARSELTPRLEETLAQGGGSGDGPCDLRSRVSARLRGHQLGEPRRKSRG